MWTLLYSFATDTRSLLPSCSCRLDISDVKVSSSVVFSCCSATTCNGKTQLIMKRDKQASRETYRHRTRRTVLIQNRLLEQFLDQTYIYYRPQTKFREGNVFIRVCHSGEGQDQTPPQYRTHWDHSPLEGTWDQTGSDIISPCNHKSGWYASYRNAFLFILKKNPYTQSLKFQHFRDKFPSSYLCH